MGLHPGGPLLYRVPQISGWSDFRRVYVLDMSTYAWSHTLKDARSWAILNTALHHGRTKLALYTAGNAGLSLGRLAYEVNRRRPRDCPRIEVNTVVDENVTPSMRAILHSWGCNVLAIEESQRRILNAETIWRKISSAQDYDVVGTPPGAWHVTDGWDGVGLLMYRLLIAQVLREIDVQYVVVPLGTGSLFLGAYMGIQDARAKNDRPRLVGAVPAGENVLQSWRQSHTDHPVEPSVMEKLVGRYTPLAPCLAQLDENHEVDFVEVTGDMLRRAARALWGFVAFEPSGAAAVAALKGSGGNRAVIDLAREREKPKHASNVFFRSDSAVLVVTSGFGLLSSREADLLKELPGVATTR
jgi:threonine dehydratase